MSIDILDYLNFHYTVDGSLYENHLTKAEFIDITPEQRAELCQAVMELEDNGATNADGEVFSWTLSTDDGGMGGSTDDADAYREVVELAEQLVGPELFEETRRKHEELIQ